MSSSIAHPDEIAGVLARTALQVQGGDDLATRVDVFDEIYLVFLALGTLVGLVVIAYLLHKAYKYRASNGDVDDGGIKRPVLGELPTGSETGGRKLFLSFALSAIIVVSLIAWTYGLLLYVEVGEAAQPEEADLNVTVTGYQFFWEFEYQDDDRLPSEEVDGLIEDHGEQAVLEALREDDLERLDDGVETNYTQSSEFVVPVNDTVHLTVTSGDVWHTFGVSDLRVKADAKPGETTTTWFIPEEEGTYQAECFELCGISHSYMTADVVVEDQESFEEWYAEQTVDRDELEAELEASVEGGGTNATADRQVSFS